MINKYRFYSMWILAVIVLLVIGTCKASQAENKWNTWLINKSISEKNYTLGTLVTSANFECSNPTRNFFMGSDNEGNAYWSIQCMYGKAYCVTFVNDAIGSTKIMGCDILKLCGVDCFKKF